MQDEYETIKVPAKDLRPGDHPVGWGPTTVITGTPEPSDLVRVPYTHGTVGNRGAISIRGNEVLTVHRPVEYVTLRVRKTTAEVYASGWSTGDSYNEVARAAKEALAPEAGC